jgi:hypothetical protein
MTLLIALAATAAYLAIWLYAARYLYGRWRAKGIDHNRREYSCLCPTTEAAVDMWNRDDRGFIMAGAFGLALIWPTIPVALAVAAFLTSTPVLSQAEMRDRLTERDRHIADLERQLGIGAS